MAKLMSILHSDKLLDIADFAGILEHKVVSLESHQVFG